MKNHFETEAFVMNVKEFQYSKGTGYNFSFPMKGEAQGEEKNTEPVVWISGVSFNQPILEKRSYLLRGKLVVKPPYKDYPAALQLIVSEAILLESGQYVVRTKRESKPEPHSTSNGMNNPSERQVAAHRKTQKAQQDHDPLFEPMSTEIPF